MSKKVFKHGIAAYPTEWRDLFISENKICFQFNNPELKTRAIETRATDLIREGCGYSLPINTHGTIVEFIAIGVQMPLHKVMQDKLLDAYFKHIEMFNDKHEMKKYLLDYAKRINEKLGDK